MPSRVVITAVLCTVVGNTMAAETDLPTQGPRSSDTTGERLQHLKQTSTRSLEAGNQAVLTQAEAIRLAKTAAKKEKGKQLDDYELNSAIFDPTNREWTASFEPKPSRRSSLKCLLIVVKDDTKETKALQC